MSILGSILPDPGALATLYKTPDAKRAVVNVSACNRGPSASRVSVALTSKETPDESEYIEYTVTIAPCDVLERTAISLAGGQKIVVMSSTGTVAFNTWGIEEVA